MAHLHETFAALSRRAQAGEIVAVGITGKPHHFAAGADLHQAVSVTTREEGLALARAGHETYGLLLDMPVPTFAYVTGVALGGGLELALSCTYRTVASSVRNIGLPEVAIGLIPGWGGSYLLPQLVGVEKAIEVILTNPLRNNKQLAAAEATTLDRKSTRLNSSHVAISYAVFCLKKKTTNTDTMERSTSRRQ